VRRRPRRRVIVVVALAVAGVALGAGLRRWIGGGGGGEQPVPPTCELGPTVRGIDVSYFQESISWKQVRKAGMQFAFIRVSDGTTVADPKFAFNWAAARRVGVLRGAYQYFHPEESAIAQADLLIAALRRDPGELPPALDVETDGGRSPAQVAARVGAWVERVRAQLRVEPIVYTGPEFWRDRAGGAALPGQALWIAHYTASCPTVPPPWARWTFWQHTDRGVVPGIDGAVDLNLFAGDYLDLEAFARRSRLGAPAADAGVAAGTDADADAADAAPSASR